MTRKLWLHNGGHGPPAGDEFDVTVNRWFDHWLFGVENGSSTSRGHACSAPDGASRRARPGRFPATRRPHGSRLGEPGTLATRRPARAPRQSFVDRGRELDTDDSLIALPDAPNPNRLAYLSPVLRSAVHVSGTPEVTLRASVDNRYAANLTAVLVDYGPGDEPPTMVTRGWIDVQNRSGPGRSTPIRQGKDYAFSFDLQPDDYVVAAGHRIGLVVVSTDHDYTLRPLPGTRLTLSPERSELSLPVVGGRAALGF